jgi:DNA processing protein
VNEREARLALARLVEPGTWSVHGAVQCEGAVEVLRALVAGRAPSGVRRELAEAVADRARGWAPGPDRDRLAAVGGRLLVPGDPEWPDGLVWCRVRAELAAPPLALCVRGTGDLGVLATRAVAVVGARTSTAYGAHVTRDLALRLAESDRAVVSGGAYGIDAHAHRGALSSATGPTVAVLASGVDVAYPRGNARLLEDVAGRGLLVSEVPPGTHPTRGRFLVRNRLIAALSLGTVVVEAALRSGSLSTAHRAHDLSRRVMIVPGPVTSVMSQGCHHALRTIDGAVLVEGAADVLELVGQVGEDLPEERRGESRVRDDLSAVAREVLDALPVRGGLGEAAIARAVGVPVLAVQQLLPPLQIHGLIARGDDGWVLTPLGIGGSR